MKVAPVLGLALLLAACASISPVPIRAGDVCFHCRRTITEPALATEVVSREKGMQHSFKFESVSCLTSYLRDHPNEDVHGAFVTDYSRGKLMTAEHAWFVRFNNEREGNAPEFAAFSSKDAAEKFAGEQGKGAAPVRWDVVKATDLGAGH